MTSPVPATPPPKPYAVVSTDRRGIKTPHLKKGYTDSPLRLTPKQVSVHDILTHPTSSSTATSPAADTLEITTVEKAKDIFETAIDDLDKAYKDVEEPNYENVILAQNLLFKARKLNNNNLLFTSFCKLEMVRISPDLDFQRYWIKRGLEDLETYSPAACFSLSEKKEADLVKMVKVVKDCCVTYQNLLKKCAKDFPDLTQRVFEKYKQCEDSLQQYDPLAEIRPPPKAEIVPANGESKAAPPEIAAVEKVDTVFNNAVLYMDEAFADPEKPRYDVILLAQDLLYKVLSQGNDNWRLSVLSKIEMTRVSSDPDFQEFWIKKALKTLDNVFNDCCKLELENKADLIGEMSSIYERISRKFFKNFEDLARHAVMKQKECQQYLNPQNTTLVTPSMTPAASPARAEPSAAHQSPPQEHDTADIVVVSPTPAASPANAEPSAAPKSPPKEHDTTVAVVAPPSLAASDTNSTVNKTKAVFLFSCVCVLGLAIAQRGRLKQLVRKISNITMIYILHPARLRSLVNRLYLENRFRMTGQSGQHG